MRSFGYGLLLCRNRLSLFGVDTLNSSAGPAWLQGSDAGCRAAEGTRTVRDRAGAGSSGDRCVLPFFLKAYFSR